MKSIRRPGGSWRTGSRIIDRGVAAGENMKQYDVISLFPPMFDAIAQYGVSGRALERSLAHLERWNPRDFATNAWRSVDDRPYGGGPGMVMQAEPLALSIEAACARQRAAGVAEPHVVCLAPHGARLDHAGVMRLGAREGLVLLCGRYEGIDERLIDESVHECVSIGDYVLSGGELAAMVLLDALLRQLPGALGDAESAGQDSFVDGLLDYPHYTRPEVWRGRSVPAVLLGGDHARIRRWRLAQSLARTTALRPDLLQGRPLSEEESALLASGRQA